MRYHKIALVDGAIHCYPYEDYRVSMIEAGIEIFSRVEIVAFYPMRSIRFYKTIETNDEK